MPEPLPTPAPIAEADRIDAAGVEAMLAGYTPVVLRGLVRHWPVVAAAALGHEALARYVSGFDNGRPAEVMVGAPAIRGRFFYSDDMRGLNFHREQVPLSVVAAELVRLAATADPPAIYAGAAATAEHLPGWAAANPLPIPLPPVTPRVWIGNASRVSTHFDLSPNLACIAAGTRRFLLFPPGQVSNLYVGPLEVTLAGQPVSMVDPDAPDLLHYPRFADAMRHAQLAVLQPGDAIFIPSLWWHNVRADGPFNCLVNYWFDQDPEASPLAALAHGLLAIRDLPPGERAAWRHWFDHYVFADSAPNAADHVPSFARGVLGPPSPARSQRLKRFLRNILGTG